MIIDNSLKPFAFSLVVIVRKSRVYLLSVNRRYRARDRNVNAAATIIIRRHFSQVRCMYVLRRRLSRRITHTHTTTSCTRFLTARNLSFAVDLCGNDYSVPPGANSPDIIVDVRVMHASHLYANRMYVRVCVYMLFLLAWCESVGGSAWRQCGGVQRRGPTRGNYSSRGGREIMEKGKEDNAPFDRGSDHGREMSREDIAHIYLCVHQRPLIKQSV